MTTAEQFGFIKPTNNDMIRDGDDAISTNADVTAAELTKLQPYAGFIGATGDFNTLLGKGGSTKSFYYVTQGALNGPPVPWSGWLEVIVTPNGLAAVQTFTNSDDSAVWQRRYLDGSGGVRWSDWRRTDADPYVTSRSAHEVLLDDFTYRRGGVKQIGKKSAISFRVDHGLANFDAKMRSKLDALGFPYALALGSRDWGASENAGITPAIVDAWVSTGGAEIWSHGISHADADTPEKLYDYIVNSKAELEADLPSAVVDGFMPPGAGGTRYMGFGPSDTPQKYFDTLAGQLILQTYAIGTGQFPGTAYRLQDGRPRVGQAYFNMDTFTASEIMVRVNNAIAEGKGIQLMIHPSLIDTAGYITTAELHSLLDQIKVLQDAGDVVVMSAYDQMLADSTAPYKVSQTAGRTVSVWDYLNNREQLIYGDTGIRDVTALAPNVTAGKLYLYRDGQTVTMIFDAVQMAGANGSGYDMIASGGIPNGFRPTRTFWFSGIDGPPGARRIGVSAAGWVPVYLSPAPGDVYRGTITWRTTQPWPTALPGVAV